MVTSEFEFQSFFKKNKKRLLKERERERERERAGEGQRERGRERERIISRLHAVSAESNAGLEPMNREIMT